MKYAYYPGCSLHSTARDYDLSTQAVCQALDIELEEIPDWVCCGASSAHMTSELLSIALPVRDLRAARDMGLDTAVCCAACYNRLKVANVTMSSNDGEVIDRVDQIVGSAYRGETKVRHLLEIIMDDVGLSTLGNQVAHDLGSLKVAAYYGCLLVRPPEAVDLDDPENPTRLDALTEALGAQAVDWPYKTECCGAGLSLTRTDVVLKLCRDIYQKAVSRGAECLMVACPLCQANLDMRQAQVNRRFKTGFGLPVLYFTQVIGLALGLSERDLGLRMAITSPRRLLREHALV
jgi:heterodisulfide reductase subunit B